ncbi:transglutaminase domain-containing protein [Candidatus Roizmanbacteria bacterium]|nr:transglutaminase domain-containing protein [Candidatus Roizmanbacteria bacterium]
MGRRWLIAFLAGILFISWPSIALADNEFQSDYQVQYVPAVTPRGLETHVNFLLTLTNLRSDVFVKKFSLTFPEEFGIRNLKAADDSGQTTADLKNDSGKTRINLEFQSPQTGKGSKNNFFIEFDQDRLFQENGSVWEVILPTIDDPNKVTYKIIVNLPPGSNKKIAIAKPPPTYVAGKQIVWDTPATRTVYAVFGTQVSYDTELTYHLKNTRLVPVYTDVAFPPDTEYQKVYVTSLYPKPSLVFQDEDGNYLGRYILSPQETKTILFKGVIELSSRPREEVGPVIQSRFADQRKYLLSENKYWHLSDIEPYKSLKAPRDIYSYLVTRFQYNYAKVGSRNSRLGATEALLRPDQAVCVEFSDSFVALAREKGIYAREIEGYGFSRDSALRPLSLAADILHSWPEYYSLEENRWIAIDPTWENTSGIDYFSSLDLNHIALAIHGKQADYPAPAGTYKIDASKDVLIQPTVSSPVDLKKLDFAVSALPKSINDSFSYKVGVSVVNNGNTFAWNVPVEISATDLQTTKQNTTIASLAPFEKKDFTFEFRALRKNKKTSARLKVTGNNREIVNAAIAVVPFYYELGLKIAVGLFVGTTILFSFFLLRRLRRAV